MEPAISIQNLGKKYKITEQQRYVALRDVISNSLKNIFNKKQTSQASFWALKDINVDIQPADRVGIIGHNGAGKSTLLKIISRITPPTTGEVIVNGRVASLLEIGTGFHPELTGRENIFLNGSILGLKKTEITQKLDAIVDFSGVEKFIDMPLKHYSSGMQLRLAFSVAAHLEPEILLIDEVLAVGDAEFKKKCLGKMQEVSKKFGRTILFVSHDLNAISTLTTSCMVINKGLCCFMGRTNEALQFYQNTLKKSELEYRANIKTDKPAITKIKIHTSEPDVQIHGEPLVIDFEVSNPIERHGLALSFLISDSNFKPILHIWSNNDLVDIGKKGTHFMRCTFPAIKLYMGTYFINTFLGDDKGKELFEHLTNVISFEVSMQNLDPGHSFGWQENICVYRETHYWEHKKQNEN